MSDLTEQLMACVELGKAVTSTLDREEILKIILNRLSQLIRAQNWTLYLMDAERQELRFEVVVGLEGKDLKRLTLKVGEGLAGMVAETGEPILVPDTGSEPHFDKRVDSRTGFKTHSLITLPLKLGERVIGVLQIINPENQELFEHRIFPILQILSDFVAISISNALNHEKIEKLVVTDDVSGFYNSRFLHQKLAEIIDSGQATSLVFLDMDNFKRIVDTYGHPMGSKVLKEVAEAIATQLAGDDFLVRYGGDEYVVVLPGRNKNEAIEAVEKIRVALNEAVCLEEDGHHVKVTASFGVANFPEDAQDLKGLLRSADVSMYRSKDRGKNTITVS
ncbi:MAG: sensor domain-containing diguanylate cyclase [bacterium]|nr:sensor domain-containing diguanylate cyclase [bacterium]